MRLFLAVAVFVLLSGIVCGDKIKVMEAYPKLKFLSQADVDSTTISSFLLSIFGINTQKDSAMKYFNVENPFYYAGGLVIVEATSDILPLQNSLATFTTKEPVSWSGIQSSVELKMHNKLGKKALSVSAFVDVKKIVKTPTEHLNSSKNIDMQFLQQIEAINDVTEEASRMGTKCLVWIDGHYLTEISNEYGEDSEQTAEASALFSSALNNVLNKLRKFHSNKVVSILVIKDKISSRRARSLLQTHAEPEAFTNKTVIGNLAYEYSEDFAVVFNIIFWLSVILIIALIAISYGIGYMDPGRDSIIYRMTSQRIKKDQ